MSYVDQDSLLWKEIEGISAEEGLCLYDLEKLGANTLRVTVENKGSEVPGDDKKAGVSIESCTKLCRRLQIIFSVEGPSFGLIEDPEIDVSSPGVNRVLRLPVHFHAALGQRVKLSWRNREQDKFSEVGMLESLEDRSIGFLPEGSDQKRSIELDQLVLAQIDFLF